MFRIDLSKNRLARLVQKRFSDLQLRERDHLGTSINLLN